ncbi:hypothetical protein [Caulobacter sp. LARHSG274]
MPSPDLPPVFVHSGWRCSSTYVWSRFRAAADVRAYYEPWHEQLAQLTPAGIERERPATSGLRHPDQGEAYLGEFAGLLRPEGGVAGYRRRFALDTFFLDPETEDPDQAAYVGGLIAAAQAKGRTPVLACCRTLGRVGWLRRRFGGTHIVLIRDPVQQWRSFHSLRKRPRPTYFELCQYVILAEAAQGAVAARRLGLGLPRGEGDLAERVQAVRRRLKRAPARTSFAAFLAVYLLSYLAALPHADLVIDVDRLGADPNYAQVMASRIAALTGVAVDFSGCRTPAPHPDRARVAYRREAMAMVEALGLSSALAAGPARILYEKLALALAEPAPRPSPWRAVFGVLRLRTGGVEA